MSILNTDNYFSNISSSKLNDFDIQRELNNEPVRKYKLDFL
jgi:hypothetical protein